MTRLISRAESWERVYEAFNVVNFSAFDFNTVKESLLDYVKLYFPEDFNDYIESSEFIAILELFAYIAELLAYRVDINTHENFITTAQRKESVLRLARLISYSPTRNLPARGLVKITSVQTTENIFDSAGRNLAGRRIIWNDSANPDWKEQFLLVINRVLEQPFGSVIPSERIQVGDVVLELYTLNNLPLTVPQPGAEVFRYSATSEGVTYPMELVPVILSSTGPEEKRPEVGSQFTLLYSNDGLGDGSDTTGFLCFTKQGNLQRITTSFDGVTPNQIFPINIININDTDVWINNVNPDTGLILTINPLPDAIERLSNNYQTRFGEWYEVDIANAQNISFNTKENRHKYEIETLDNDQIRIIFGDGEFADIPNGTFHIWYRTSANDDITISKNAIQNVTSAFTYIDISQQTQTFTFTFSLTTSLLNASASEDIEHIRRVAPSVYYTQDRMVNGRDYNTFLLQDPSIIKMRSFNRTFAGDSKYITWHDPSGSYENVKIFGDDLALYFANQPPATGKLIEVFSPIDTASLLLNVVQPILSSADFFAVLAPKYQEIGIPTTSVRTSFTTNEFASIQSTLASPQVQINVYFSVQENSGQGLWSTDPTHFSYPYLHMFIIDKKFVGSLQTGWSIRYATNLLVAHSETTKFWNTNDGQTIITYDSLNPNQDQIVVLSANINAQGAILGTNLNYHVLSLGQSDIQLGLPDIRKLNVLPEDTNNDGIADNMDQFLLFDLIQQYNILTLPFVSGEYVVSLPRSYIRGYLDQELEVYFIPQANPQLSFRLIAALPNVDITEPATVDVLLTQFGVINKTYVDGIGNNYNISDGGTIRVIIKDFVYFTRDTISSEWYPVIGTNTTKLSWLADQTQQFNRWQRFNGRYPLNFAWFHRAATYNLIDPAASNIIDMYIITRGYYNQLRSWLAGQIEIEPIPPTPLDLRSSYGRLLGNKMISDTVVLHSGKFKLLFGSRSLPSLRARFKVIRPMSNVLMTDNEVRVKIVEIITSFFNPLQWEFGETFYFTELAAAIHKELGTEIDSIVLVPLSANNQFGDLFQIQCREDELFLANVTVNDIEVVTSYTPKVLRQNSE